jgi:parallel beta-helix repeat protein
MPKQKIIGNQIMYNGLKYNGEGIWLAFEAGKNLIQGNNITDNWVAIFAYISGSTLICEKSHSIKQNWRVALWSTQHSD